MPQRLVTHIRFLRAVFARLRIARHALGNRLPRRVDQVRATVVMLVLWLRTATNRQIPVPALRLMVDGSVRPIRMRSDTEFFGAYEVFGTSDYESALVPPVHRVLDLGANVGFASMLLTERYPSADIVAVEAAPDTFEALAFNVSGLRNVRAMQFAIGTDGPVRLDLSAPSSERRVSCRGIEVVGISLSELLNRLDWTHVDLLKIDVEGAEFAVFDDPAMGCVAAIVGEIHHTYAPAGWVSTAASLPDFHVEADASPFSSTTLFRAIRIS